MEEVSNNSQKINPEQAIENKRECGVKSKWWIYIPLFLVLAVIFVLIGYYISQRQLEDRKVEEVTQVEEEKDIEIVIEGPEDIYTKLENIVAWDSKEKVSDWGVVNLDSEVLSSLSCNIVSLSRVINSTLMSGTNIELQLQLYNQEREEYLREIKELLIINGWDIISGPVVNDWYSDYLYSKEKSYILLQEGGRDSVLGGIYVRVKYCE